MVQATKNKEESCSFLDAIGRRSCGPLNGLAKNRHVGNPSFDSSGSRQLVGMLRCALSLSSDSQFACISFACISRATESEVHASGNQFCSISDPPPLSLSLSLSLSPCDQIREKESLRLNTTIRTSKRKFAKCGHQVQGSRAPTASMQWLIQKKKCRAFSCNVKLCFAGEFRTTSNAWPPYATTC